MAKKVAKKKKSVADTIEQEIRKGYLPAQLGSVLGEIMAIEHNARWCATEAGKAAAARDHGYEGDQLGVVLKKQAENLGNLNTRKQFIKDEIDREHAGR